MSTDYLQGIVDAVGHGDIVDLQNGQPSANWQWYSQKDRFSHIDKGIDRLNSRRLEKHIPRLLAHLRDIGDQCRLLVLGPGIGNEIADIRNVLPESHIHTVTHTPIHPSREILIDNEAVTEFLLDTLPDIVHRHQRSMSKEALSLCPRAFRDGYLPIGLLEEIHRKKLAELFAIKRLADKQFIGDYVDGGVPGESYDAIIENRGPIYHVRPEDAGNYLKSTIGLLKETGMMIIRMSVYVSGALAEVMETVEADALVYGQDLIVLNPDNPLRMTLIETFGHRCSDGLYRPIVSIPDLIEYALDPRELPSSNSSGVNGVS